MLTVGLSLAGECLQSWDIILRLKITKKYNYLEQKLSKCKTAYSTKPIQLLSATVEINI